MEDTRLIFCCSCESIVPASQAQYVFRTGFYRIKYPLGCCQDCMQLSAFAQLAAGTGQQVPKPNEQDKMDETDGYV